LEVLSEREKGRRTKEMLKRVEGKSEAAMVVDGFSGGDAEEHGSLSDRHSRCPMGNHGTQGVEDEAFERVVIESAVGVRTVETMMDGVDVFVEELVDVEGSVPEVLPCVEDESG
jgi:hypothetical protein